MDKKTLQGIFLVICWLFIFAQIAYSQNTKERLQLTPNKVDTVEIETIIIRDPIKRPIKIDTIKEASNVRFILESRVGANNQNNGYYGKVALLPYLDISGLSLGIEGNLQVLLHEKYTESCFCSDQIKDSFSRELMGFAEAPFMDFFYFRADYAPFLKRHRQGLGIDVKGFYGQLLLEKLEIPHFEIGGKIIIE